VTLPLSGRSRRSRGSGAGPVAPPLRVALLWNGAVQAEELIDEPRPVVLGEGADALFPLPEGVVTDGSLPVLEPDEAGYRLRLSSVLGGDVWLSGVRQAVRALASGSSAIDLGPEDYGVITIGPVAVFFQHVRPARSLPRSWLPEVDGGLVAGVGLALFLFTSLAILAVLAERERPDPDPLELPTDLVARYMVVPPPEDLLEPPDPTPSGTDNDDPGLQARDEAGGAAAPREEGRVAEREAPERDEPPEVEGERREVVQRVRRLGLLGALSGGGEQNAIAEALDAPSVGEILGGLGSTRTVVARGPGGAGLRGAGDGGGGQAGGSLFAAGDLGTGAGAGPGAGAGRGRRGPGARGRPRQERTVQVSRGNPRVSGFLSAAQINRVVRANQAAVRYCYDTEVQRQPNLAGQVKVQWRIDRNGRVSMARIASSSLRNARVEGCIIRQVRRWRFPKPDGGEVTVEYPFVMRVGG